MFGIGGGELVFIIFIALMLFGSDKIPVIARNLGKGMAQIKNATNEIKSEINRSAEENGIKSTFNDITNSFDKEVDSIKGSLNANISNPVDIIKEDISKGIDDLTGPIKRQM
jgi:sec-independent protein translocase protein TatA